MKLGLVVRTLTLAAAITYANALAVGCTAQQRAEVRTALSVNEAACAVAHALKGKPASLVSEVCAIELPLAEAIVNVVAAQGDVP